MERKQKKGRRGRGRGEEETLPVPRHPFFFLLLSQLSRRTSRGNACYAGYKQRRLIQVCACRLVFPGCVVTYLNFDSMSVREVIDNLNVVNSLVINREPWHRRRRRRRQRNRHFEKAFAFFQTLSRLFQSAENIKCRRISLKVISWGPNSRLDRESTIRRRLFTSSIKRKIRHFHVVVAQ